MSVGGMIRARAAAYAGLTALVATRVYNQTLPQSPTLPAVVFARIGEGFEHASGADEVTRHALYQFSSWGTTYETAKAVAEQVHLAFSRYSGTLDSTVVEGIFAENIVDLYDDPVLGYQVAEDMTIHYRAS